MLRALSLAIGLWNLLLWLQPVKAQEKSSRPITSESLPEFDWDREKGVLYDANTIGFDRDGKRYLFEGDVVLIGGAYVITADKVDVAYFKKEMTATGHVIILHNDQIFTGDQVQLAWQSGDMSIRNAVLVASDKAEVARVSQRVLGQSAQELEYEAARKVRLKAITVQKAKLRESFRKEAAAEPGDELLSAYTQLLEKEVSVQNAESPNQAERDPERRKRYQRRRSYWERARALALKDGLPQTYYFRIEGEQLTRRDEFFYETKDASFTPCFCDQGETPAWGFQAAEIQAQQEGYIDLKHPVLMIKGLPILYLPYLKLPLKVKRQSGFLMPAFQSGEQKNGFVYTQPVFFDLAPNADATVTADLFERRGTRMGVETRYEARRYSGFRLQGELIRDRSWLELGRQRDDLSRYHLIEQPYCTQDDPIEKQICEQQVQDNLRSPSNTWRGQQEWAGTYFLAPRLSVVSKGKMLSDHRYLEDLYLAENIVAAFVNQANAAAFSRAGVAAHFDGKDFFVALSSRYADPMLSSERYSGQQVPLDFRLQTRYFRLLPESWLPVPVYAEIQARSQLIAEKSTTEKSSAKLVDATLGDGVWQRYGLQVTTPLSRGSLIQVDHFAEAELRLIRSQLAQSQSSSIRSWRTGLSLQLPVDGTGQLPEFLQGAEEGPTYVRHMMNWGLSLSARPVVIRDGNYGTMNDRNGALLVYFPSERKKYLAEDRDVADESMMVTHQRLTLSSNHRWQVFERSWQKIEPEAEEESAAEETQKTEALEDLHTQAHRELMAAKERKLGLGDERPDGTVDWLNARYRSFDTNQREPLNFDVRMTFDYQQEKLRRQQLDRNRLLEAQAQIIPDPAAASTLRSEKVNYFSLPESWLGPFVQLGANWQGFSANSQLVYNIYKKTSTALSFELGLPAFYQTQLGARYVLEKSPELDIRTDNLLFKKTKTVTAGLSSTLIPFISIGANLIQKQVEQTQAQYGSSYQIGYDDRSGCWGLRFLREKDLNQLEEDANYIVQLAVIFLGNRRGGDISPGIERELKIGSGRQR